MDSMNEKKESRQHLQVPEEMELEKDELLDVLVYGWLKMYMDNTTKKAYPSLKTLSDKTGLTINTVRKSLDRLQRKKLITIIKDKKYNIYVFNNYDKFEVFSKEFLENTELNPRLKAFTMATQRYMFKDMFGIGKVSLSNQELALRLKISERSVKKYCKELENLGYLVFDGSTKFFMLEKLGQAIIWKLKEHEERMDKQDEKIEEVDNKYKEKYEETSKRLANVEKQLYNFVNHITREANKKNKFEMT